MTIVKRTTSTAGATPLVAPVAKRTFPGLLEYLESRLGKARGHGEERHFFCPFCIDRLGSESSKPKLDVNIRSGRAGCYRCGFGTKSLETFFRKLNKGTISDVEMRLVAGQVKLPEKSSSFSAVVRASLSPKAAPVASALRRVPLPVEYVPLSDCLLPQNLPLARHAIRYMREVRGASDDLWGSFRIGYAWEGRYAGRLIFPVVMGGKQVYFTTRFAGDHQIKSLNAPFEDGCVSRDDVLLNYDACVGASRIAVVEGPFSCMAFYPPELDCPAVATLGKMVSDRQIALIEGLVPYGLQEVVIALDADAAAKNDELRSKLAGRVPVVSSLKFGDKDDPWDRRDDLAAFLAGRGALSLAERVKGRLTGAAFRPRASRG